MAKKFLRGFSLEERCLIEKLIKENYFIKDIANILERSVSGIKNEISKNLGKNNYCAQNAHQFALEREKQKSRKLQKKITPEQLDVINQGMAEGWTNNKISNISGISHWKLSKYFKENNIQPQSKNYISFESRIDALEDQMELLFNQIREIKNDQRNKKL